MSGRERKESLVGSLAGSLEKLLAPCFEMLVDSGMDTSVLIPWCASDVW